MRSIDQLLWLRRWMIRVRRPLYRLALGVDIPDTASVSFSARFRPHPGTAITIGEQTLIAFRSLLLCYDPSSGRIGSIRVGSGCFVGGNSIIMPGVTIGDGSIVGAGSVVFADVPARSIVGGNPARILRSDIEVGPKGRLPTADATARAAKLAARERRDRAAV